MRKIVDYQLCDASNCAAILSRGFEPYGSPVMRLTSSNSSEVMQAFVKYEDDTKPSELLSLMSEDALQDELTRRANISGMIVDFTWRVKS